ncbi:histidine phosphatase family protein [Alphaproteobacteria bacterium]|nr:histidine phosphatase family protein [Alphaproteobacteria bacterium]
MPDYAMHSQTKYDRDIAKSVVEKGGYILFVRHAHREKWIDVTMYDALEATKYKNAEDSYFKNAVCLSSMGMIQGRAMGEIVNDIKLPIQQVISSPSCRARQTAKLGFNGYDKIDQRLMHFYGDPYGPYNLSKREFLHELKGLLLDLKPEKGKNIIVSAHNMMITEEILDEAWNKNTPIDPQKFKVGLEEGGFFVLKVKRGKLVYVTKFHSFQGFAKTFFKRPTI